MTRLLVTLFTLALVYGLPVLIGAVLGLRFGSYWAASIAAIASCLLLATFAQRVGE